jgi:hypothetical protein
MILTERYPGARQVEYTTLWIVYSYSKKNQQLKLEKRQTVWN